MLAELIVEGLGVIDRAELSLTEGSTAVTGETGAGKTLLVAAIGLLLGDRADRVLVGPGRAEARVEGRFVVPAGHPARDALAEAGFGDAFEIVASRSITAEGRARIRINGRLTTAAQLGSIVSSLVEVTGQHEHARIGARAVQRRMLDSYAGAAAAADEVAADVRAAAQARREAAELAARRRERSRTADILAYEIAEIEEAGVHPGEWDELAAQALRLEHAESIAAAVADCSVALRGEPGAEDLVDRAHRGLESVAGADPELGALAGRLETVALELGDIASALAARADEPDPAALDEIRSRRAVISRLRRKYGDDDDAVAAYLESARARLGDLEGEGDQAVVVAARAEELGRRAELAAAELSEQRRRHAPELEREVAAVLGQLAMPGARFEVALEPRDLYEGGAETVEFRIAARPDEPARPIASVASGGELARIALALHLVATGERGRALVFDEVDAGIGGRAAQAVGQALAGLGRAPGAQVLVVTHLPQVAAHADRHYRVVRTERGVTVEAVDGDDRITELSRMLAGLPDSDRARLHARELLDMAAEAR